MDMTGKLIIKAGLDDDIRRIPIHNEDITYDELILMMQRVFKGKLKATDEILIKYKDEDGDLITLSDDSDLAFAIQSGGKILKITLFINSRLCGANGDNFNTKAEMRKKLECIQQCLNNVLSGLDSLSPDEFSCNGMKSVIDAKKQETRERESRSSSRCSGVVAAAGSKEFDPLTGTHKNLTPQPSVQTLPGSPRSATPAGTFLAQGSPKHLSGASSNPTQDHTVHAPPQMPYGGPSPSSGYIPGSDQATVAQQHQQQPQPQPSPHQSPQQPQPPHTQQVPPTSAYPQYQNYVQNFQPQGMYYPAGYPQQQQQLPQQAQPQQPHPQLQQAQPHMQQPHPQQPHPQQQPQPQQPQQQPQPPTSQQQQHPQAPQSASSQQPQPPQSFAPSQTGTAVRGPPGPPTPGLPPSSSGPPGGANMYAGGGLSSKAAYQVGYR